MTVRLDLSDKPSNPLDTRTALTIIQNAKRRVARPATVVFHVQSAVVQIHYDWSVWLSAQRVYTEVV